MHFHKKHKSFPLDFFIAICQYIDMICIYCFHTKTRVTNSRTHKKHPQIWRRRQCDSCKQSFTSYERAASDTLRVISPTSRQPRPFSLGILTISIAQAFTHQEPKQAARDSYELAHTVELRLLQEASATEHTTTPQAIAHTTYNTLKQFDEMAGLQYAAKHQLITSLRRRGRPSTVHAPHGN